MKKNIRVKGKKFIKRTQKKQVELWLSPNEHEWLTQFFAHMVEDKEEWPWQQIVSKELIDHSCLILHPQLKAEKTPLQLTINAAMVLDTICDAGLEYALEAQDTEALYRWGGFFGGLKLKVHQALHA